jgi:hypothetical protein
VAQDFTTTAFLASLKRRGMIPATAEALSDSDFLAIATEELQTYCMEVLLSLRDEYKVADYDVSIVAGADSYLLPERAAGDKVRQVLKLVNGVYVPLDRLELNRRSEYEETGDPTGYYFQDNELVLVPEPSQSGTLRVKYFRRPSKLVATSAVATVSSINGARTVITTSAAIPATFTSGVTVDVVDNNPGFKLHAMDYATTGTVSGTTITLSTALPASVVAGDYVCLAGEAPVPMVPVEMHKLLVLRTRAEVLDALGDPKAEMAEAATDRERTRVIRMLAPRDESTARYLINRNGPGFKRIRSGFRFR